MITIEDEDECFISTVSDTSSFTSISHLHSSKFRETGLGSEQVVDSKSSLNSPRYSSIYTSRSSYLCSSSLKKSENRDSNSVRSSVPPGNEEHSQQNEASQTVSTLGKEAINSTTKSTHLSNVSVASNAARTKQGPIENASGSILIVTSSVPGSTLANAAIATQSIVSLATELNPEQYCSKDSSLFPTTSQSSSSNRIEFTKGLFACCLLL